MAYGHAERNLFTIRSLDRQTEHLLQELKRTNPDRAAWLRTLFTDSASIADSTPPANGVHGTSAVNGAMAGWLR